MIVLLPVQVAIALATFCARLLVAVFSGASQARRAGDADKALRALQASQQASWARRDALDVDVHREALRAALPKLFDRPAVPKEVRAWVDAPDGNPPEPVTAWIIQTLDVVGAHDRYRAWVAMKETTATGEEREAFDRGYFRPSIAFSIESYLVAAIRHLSNEGRKPEVDAAVAKAAVKYACILGKELDRRNGLKAA